MKWGAFSMFTKFFKSISDKFSSSDEKKLQYWKKNDGFIKALTINGINISILDNNSLPEIKSFMKKNKNDDGFLQMQSTVRNCSDFKKIVNNEIPKQCFIARENSSEKKLVGFVIIANNISSNIGMISELGIDSDYRRDAKSQSVRKAGSSLLFIGCNELFSKGLDTVCVIASEDNSLAFYKRWGFKVMENGDEDELAIKQKKYLSNENEFIELSSKPLDSKKTFSQSSS